MLIICVRFLKEFSDNFSWLSLREQKNSNINFVVNPNTKQYIARRIRKFGIIQVAMGLITTVKNKKTDFSSVSSWSELEAYSDTTVSFGIGLTKHS